MRPPSVEREAALAACRDAYYGHGKLEILPKFNVGSLDDIATLYTPGVAYSVQEIITRPEALHELSAKDNTIAVVTDGTAVLGLGRAGPRAAVPVMEGKAAMFKLLAGIDAIPLCIATEQSLDLIDILVALEPTFGGYNIEDVASPDCFALMTALESRLNVPAIHDDQYGTATVIAAALINAFKVTGRSPRDQRVVINGAGAAGTATFDLLRGLGVGDIIVNDRDGILCEGNTTTPEHHVAIAEASNRERRRGHIADAVREADVFIGVSTAAQLNAHMVRSMRRNPIVFALANPVPEIMPEEALAAGAAIVATGRFDYPNQCNNVLAFPALMRAALDTRAKKFDREVYLVTARAIAAEIDDAALGPSSILPTPLSPTLYPNTAEATAQAIVARGLARRDGGKGSVAENTRILRELVAERQSVLRPRTLK
ncbi:MAG: malic enzyme-like NAD(P)-binding protein [Xanthobacteraceae bacterium]